MKYDVCIVGHGNFPDGVKSAMELLVGCDNDIQCFNLNGKKTHDEFHDEMTKYLQEHKNVLVFADMTGGAPYQITAEIILKSNKKNQYVVSSISLNAILDLYLKNSMEQIDSDNIEETIKHVIDESRKLMQMTPNHIEIAEEEVEEGWI